MNQDEAKEARSCNRVLIVVGDASETVDTLYPLLRVQEDGFVPIVAGPQARRS